MAEFSFEEMFCDENEKPLEHRVTDGGFASIFRTIGCVGDSLSSGEFESIDAMVIASTMICLNTHGGSFWAECVAVPC